MPTLKKASKTHMNVFAVISLNQSSVAAVKNAVASAFAENFIEAGSTVWLIADSGTVVSASNKLGIPENSEVTSVLVVSFTAYYGRANSTIWEWIKTKLESQP